MKIIFALLIIIFLAFSGYHLTFRRVQLPIIARRFYLTGTEFLFLGLLLGPAFLNLLDETTQKGLIPLSSLILGWIGMLYGFQFEFRKIKKFPLEYLIAAHVQSILTMSIVFILLIFFFPIVFHLTEPVEISRVLIFSAVAACSAQTGIALVASKFSAENRHIIHLLRYISSMDGGIAMVVFTLAYIYTTLAPEASLLWEPVRGLILVFSVSMVMLLLFLLLLSRRLPENELILTVIGMAILTSGTASAFSFSPLVTHFIIGLCLVNFSREKERIYSILVSIEKPAYILILVFLGAIWQFNSGQIFAGALIYCFFRFTGKIVSGYLISRLFREIHSPTTTIGFGLLEQGGLPLAMILDFSMNCPDMPWLTSMIIIAVIFNDFISLPFLKKLIING